MPRHLFLVARDSQDLAGYLQAEFKSEPEVEVLLNRRFGDRRRSPLGVDAERRQTDRRERPHVDAQLKLTSYAIVTIP
jgi:hypothetical protein